MRAPFALGLLCLAAVGCGGIPNGRYGVENVSIHGATRMDPESVQACLGTRERPRVTLDIGVRGTPACNDPPFDADHIVIPLFSWPWEDWPLFDASVFERDVERIERWYRARGFYEARVISTEVFPRSAAEAMRTDVETCGTGPGSDCSVDVSFTVEEGEPVMVTDVALRGWEDLPEGTRERLRGVLAVRSGQRFDEALYEETKVRMLRLLNDTGYADAVIRGEVKINRQRREATVVFVIAEGLTSVIGEVCVMGYGDELPPHPMLAVAALDAGSPYSLASLEAAQRALYGLGVFSGVTVNPVTVDPPEVEDDDLVDEGERPSRPVCSGSGTAGEDGACVCRTGFTGNACQFSDLATCTGHGVAQRDGSCVCNEGRAGVSCEISGPQTCIAGPRSVPPDHRAVRINIVVTPGRIWRWGIGLGFQAGQAVSFGTVASYAEQTDAAQWDIHGSFSIEHRNLFDNLIRARLEIRPRLIFEMPFLNPVPVQPLPVGLQANATLRWPAFLEPRTNLLVEIRYDLGPMPFTGFYRSDLTGAVGPERTFFDNRLYLAGFLRANWFLPTDRQPEEPTHQLLQNASVWLEEIITLDFRDDARNPTEGAYLAVTSQQGVQPLGSWDFVRFTADARVYIPLPLGIVIAFRGEIGIMEVFGSSIDPDNVYQLAQLGPPALQLRGGGASSNRGYTAGLMGDVEQLYITLPRDPQTVAIGGPIGARPIRVSGGTRLWEASLEIRVPVTVDFGLVFFADAGDVDRRALSVPGDGPGDFRFTHPQFAFGFGLRYRTIIGPLRLDVGVRPDELQVLGAQSTLPPPCTSQAANRCRPINYVDLFGLRFPGAFHLTIGEAF